MTVLEASTDDLVTLLRARGMRVTCQRLIVLRELRRRPGHRTAHDVTEAVRPELPGLSTPTVYAVLDLLTELGLIRKLDLGLPAAVYDARTEPHGHTVCRVCGVVADLDHPLDQPALLAGAAAAGFLADAVELAVTGSCRDCAQAAQRGGGGPAGLTMSRPVGRSSSSSSSCQK